MNGHARRSQLQILLVGNNPIELGSMLEKIKQLKGRIVTAEIAFDIRSVVERLLNFRPNLVLIDDNIGSHELRLALSKLNGNKRTKNIPVTVVKNSNYIDVLPGAAAVDFILKPQLTAESLYHALKNSLKLSRTRNYLYRTYRKRKMQLIKLLR